MNRRKSQPVTPCHGCRWSYFLELRGRCQFCGRDIGEGHELIRGVACLLMWCHRGAGQATP